jgi:hypothetical protein
VPLARYATWVREAAIARKQKDFSLIFYEQQILSKQFRRVRRIK